MIHQGCIRFMVPQTIKSMNHMHVWVNSLHTDLFFKTLLYCEKNILKYTPQIHTHTHTHTHTPITSYVYHLHLQVFVISSFIGLLFPFPLWKYYQANLRWLFISLPIKVFICFSPSLQVLENSNWLMKFLISKSTLGKMVQTSQPSTHSGGWVRVVSSRLGQVT